MAKTITELAKRYDELQTKHEEQSDILKAISTEWEALETELLEAMAEEGVNSVRLDGIGLISMSVSNYLSVNAANKPGFYEYLKAAGHGGLLKEEVNPKTLTAFLKGHLEELIKGFQENYDMDTVAARDAALIFINDKGASYFTKRGISLRKGK